MDISQVHRQGDVHLIPDERPKSEPVRHDIPMAPGSQVRFVSRAQRRWALRLRGAAAVGDTSGIVLAAGEATGHHHKVKEPRARLETKGNALFLVVGNKGATLTHQEHAPIELPPGTTFRVAVQREYTPPRAAARTGSSRRVAD